MTRELQDDGFAIGRRRAARPMRENGLHGRQKRRFKRTTDSEHIHRVHEASFGLYGARKVWRKLLREKVTVARCAVERLMKAMGLAGVRRGKSCVTTVPDRKAACPLDRACQEFRVRAGIMGKKETRYVPTQRACDTERVA